MEVVDYENIEDVALSVSEGWYSGDSTVPWLNSPKIDASTSVNNIPVSEAILEWTLNVVRWRTNTVNFSAVNENTVDWSAGTLTMPDGTIYNIAAGSTWIMTAITYIYLDVNVSETTLQLTTNSGTCVWEDKLLVCVAKNQTAPKYAVFQNFGTNTQDVFITADNIAANSITANEMQVNSLSALSADMWTLTSGTITLNSAGHIKSGQTNYNAGVGFFLWVSWWKPTFSIKWDSWQYIAFNWDTISLNVPISYSQITWTPTIPVIPNYIKSTYIDSTSIISPNITGATITGWVIQTATAWWQRVVINWSTNIIDFYNTDWVLSWQISWWKVGSTHVLALSSSWYVYCWWTFLSQRLLPLSNDVYDLWAITLWYRNMYLTGVIDFDSWDWQLSEFSWYPRRSVNWWSNRYIPIVTWASTNKSTNASIKVSLWWSEYYINVLAA